MSDSYLAVGRVWELCGEDTVSDNDTSGMAARSEKMFPDSRLQNFYINIERKGIKEYAKSNKKSGKEKVSQI